VAVVDVEFRANANFSGLISQANMANAAISRLQGSVTSLNAEQISQAFAEFSKGLTGSGQYIAQTVRVSDATQRFGQDLVNNKLQLKDYAREFGRYVSGRESQIKKLADQQVRMQQSLVVSRGMDPSGRLIAQVFTPTGLTNDLETNTMRATARLQVMNEFLHKASTSVINWGKNTQWAGRQMTVGLTVPLSMLATATGKAFYELDTQLIQMQKVYGTGIKGVGDEAIASIRSQVMDLSRELAKAYGIPVAQTAALAADIAQAGKTGQDLLSSVEQTTKLATLGEIDRQDAMKATLSIQSTFNQNTKELSESINFLNAVENATNVSLQDLVTGIPKAGPVVKALGGDIKDLSLMMVAMKEGGIPASEAANAIKSSLASLINPTQKVTDKMKTFGIDLVGIVDKNAGQLMPTLVEFRNEINKLDELSRQRILEELFGKFQFARVNALFNNLGRAGSQTIQVMELMGLSTAELAGIADKELKTMAESASGRFKRLFATVQGDLAVAGEGILNAGSTILSVISKIINAFEKFPDGLKKFLGGTALLAAVIGPIIMTIGVLGNFFGYIMKGLALMRTFGRRGASDFQLMTAETIATANAGDMLENKLFDQAKAADLLRTSIEKLTASLVEMGTVSSTAGSAATSSLTTTEGRGLGAVTAINAQTMKDIEGRKRALPEDIEVGHQISASNLGAGGTKQTVRFAGSMTRENADVNQAHKNINRALTESSAAMDEAAATAGTSIALLKTSVKNAKRLTQAEAERLARYMNDTTLSLEQKRQYFNDFFKNPDAFDDFIKTAITETKIQRKELDKIAGMSESAMKGQITKLTAARKKEMEELGIDAKEIELVLASINNAIDTSLDQKLFALKNLDAKLYSQATGSTGLITSSQGGKVGEPIASGPLVVGGMTGAAGGTENTLDLKTLQELQKLNQNLDENTAATKADTATEKQGQAVDKQGQAVDKESIATTKNDTAAEKQGQVVDKEQTAAIKLLTTATIADASAEAMGAGAGLIGLDELDELDDDDKPGRGRGRGRGAMMGAGMALSMGSMFTSNAKIGGAMMGGGMALSMAEMIPDGAFKSIIDKSTKIKGALTGIGKVGSKLKLLGPAIFNPWVGSIVALGAATYFVYRRMQNSFDQSNTWMRTSEASAERLGYKYYDLSAGAETLAEKTDAATESVKKLSEEIRNAPKDDPYRQIFDDWANDKDDADTVSKAVAFYNLQLVRGVSATRALEEVQAGLKFAGKEGLVIPVQIGINEIDTKDAAGKLSRALDDTFSSVTPPSFLDNVLSRLPAAMFAGESPIMPGEQVSALTDTRELDETKFANFVDTFSQLVASNQKLSPEKWQAFTSTINSSSANQSILNTADGLEKLRTGFLNATNSVGNPVWEAAAKNINSLGDEANLLYLKLNNITPAATAAGWAVQVAFSQATAASLALGRSKLAGLVPTASTSRPSSGGRAEGGDPYKAQKEANRKRIDQEKDIIKAIEKKRDAEKKAFEEKKKQDDYINKQADLQIGYREALATGDFAAAARVKNEILAEQARKRLEDAQSNKDDKYQNEIDKRQATIDKIEEANKKLDALSSKASQASSAAITSVGTQTSTTITSVQTIYDTVMADSKGQSFDNVAEMKKYFGEADGQLTGLKVNSDKFFEIAFTAYEDQVSDGVGTLKGVSIETSDTLIKLGATIADIEKIADFDPGSKEQKEFIAKLMEDLESWANAPTPGAQVGSGSGGGGNSRTAVFHDGGPIGPGMTSNRMGKSIRSPIANDERFILAQDGEYMISAAAAGIIGRKNLDAINNGKLPVAAVGGNSGSNYNFTVNAAPGQDAKQIAQEVHRIFQINERRKGGART
jgi:TP901 family phage tail tape measure protein